MRKSKEGYFQFSVKPEGTYLTVYPSVNGGQKVLMEDILYYVEKKKVPIDDVAEVKKLTLKSEGGKLKVSSQSANPVGEFGEYRMSSDCKMVEAVFYPPFEEADELSVEEITQDLRNMGVRAGINEDVIKEFIDDRKYGKAYKVASFIPPREGANGYIEYKFNPELKPAPKMKDDGSVDFHSLENVNRIKKGDVVAVLHPEDPGEDGSDLLGNPIHPLKVKRAVFRYNRNLQVSDDGLSLISLVNGHVTLESDKIFASNVMELVNIDNSTGDIDYEGNLEIKGNVLAGFSVRATGDISIGGIVEGAYVYAGGNITLNRGVQGMNKAEIIAGGNIVSKFIESTKNVQAGGNIETDSILHSRVNAKGYIKAQGKNGLIIGGDVKSLTMVEAKLIGNTMGTATNISVGMDPTTKMRVDELQKELMEKGNSKVQLNQIVTSLRKMQEVNGKLSPEKVELQQKTMRNLIMVEKQISELKREYEDLKAQLSEESNARIKVYDAVFNGVKLTFGEQFFFIKQKYDHCQFVKERGEIKNILL